MKKEDCIMIKISLTSKLILFFVLIAFLNSCSKEKKAQTDEASKTGITAKEPPKFNADRSWKYLTAPAKNIMMQIIIASPIASDPPGRHTASMMTESLPVPQAGQFTDNCFPGH